jgi:hypothetical protein
MVYKIEIHIIFCERSNWSLVAQISDIHGGTEESLEKA